MALSNVIGIKKVLRNKGNAKNGFPEKDFIIEF